MTKQKTSIAAEEPKATADKAPTKVSRLRSLMSSIFLILAVPLAAFLLITYVFQSFQVDGQSMERTFQNGDRLIVWKVPRSLARVTQHDYIPRRSEIIVFHKYEAEYGGNRQLVKRVVGLPGDRVVVKHGRITVYNQANPDGFNPDTSAGFPDTIVGPTRLDVDIQVQAGEVFVCGDNRDHSIDSRTFGVIQSSQIVGRVALRILPPGKFHSYL